MIRKMIKCRNTQNRFSYPIRIIYPFLMFFKTIGLLTASIRVDFNQKNNICFGISRCGILYNIILLSCCLILHILMILQNYSVTFNYPGKSLLIDNIIVYQVIVSGIVVTVILLSYCFKQKSMARIGNKLIEVHTRFGMIEFLPRRKAVLHRSIAFGVVHFFMLMLHCVLLYTIYQACDFLSPVYIHMYFLTSFPASLLICYSVLQYFLIVIFIDAKFVEMNRCMKYVSKSFKVIFSNHEQRAVSDLSSVKCIVFVKDMYNQLITVCNVANDCFSVAILFITMHIFYNLTTDVLYIMITTAAVNEPNYIINLAQLIVTIIYTALPISLLSFAVTKLVKKTEETALIVHKLLNYTNDPELISELSLFSLQLLHEKPRFTACGFFDLDCSLLQGIIGAVTTYMVILVQFQRSST